MQILTMEYVPGIKINKIQALDELSVWVGPVKISLVGFQVHTLHAIYLTFGLIISYCIK